MLGVGWRDDIYFFSLFPARSTSKRAFEGHEFLPLLYISLRIPHTAQGGSLQLLITEQQRSAGQELHQSGKDQMFFFFSI